MSQVFLEKFSTYAESKRFLYLLDVNKFIQNEKAISLAQLYLDGFLLLGF